MKTIWKYSLAPTIVLNIPIGAELLSVQVQKDEICLWVLVDSEEEMEQRHFIIYGTGHPIDKDETQQYIDTIQLAGGALVFHIFEILK